MNDEEKKFSKPKKNLQNFIFFIFCPHYNVAQFIEMLLSEFAEEYSCIFL